jgi:hypothetical protein
VSARTARAGDDAQQIALILMGVGLVLLLTALALGGFP